MSTLPAEPQLVLGLESAGILLTPEEFDSVEEYDENYRYELIHGVLVVHSIPLPAETGPNELLGYYLLSYKLLHPQGSALSDTLPQQYVRTERSRRLADRLIWTGLGRLPNLAVDVATIAVEFVSAGRRSRRRDYDEKRIEYLRAGVQEYWIIDRFQRTMTVFRQSASGPVPTLVHEGDVYRAPLLPGFELPLSKLLEAADRWAAQ
jgi:Uma2 family endonuclease